MVYKLSVLLLINIFIYKVMYLYNNFYVLAGYCIHIQEKCMTSVVLINLKFLVCQKKMISYILFSLPPRLALKVKSFNAWQAVDYPLHI